MDGYAVASAATAGASETAPRSLRVPAEARPVNTGEPIPNGYDAVVMIEDVHLASADTIEIMAAASPWQHVRLLGEDVVATEVVATGGRRLDPVDVATLISAQVWSVEVVARPRVALIPTGSEVIRPGDGAAQRPRPGQVIDSDSTMLAGLLESWGAEPVVHDPVPDDPELLRAAMVEAARTHQLVAMIAGSSAGTADHVPGLIERQGELLVHGLRVSPGKPASFGVVEGVIVIGVPGYAVAAWAAFDLFAKPAVHRLLGVQPPERPRVTARFQRKVASRSGVRELLRVRLGRIGDELVAVPLKRGASAIGALSQADGLAIVPEMVEGLSPGDPVEVELLASTAELDRTVLVVGSHDVALDLLAHELAVSGRSRLASAQVGSLGGLRAIAQGEAHVAGTHLLDPADGSYNISYVQRLLPGVSLRLVHLFDRDIGFMVAPGNPKGIHVAADLARGDVVMINRQRGAGTRVLLDHLLATGAVDAGAIAGYSREVTTHTMAAAAVSGGVADVAIGIRAAATALRLDFVPIARERYDLVVPAVHLGHLGVARLLEIASGHGAPGRRFHAAVAALGGYDLARAGEVVFEQ
jgi:putative molybdopterin biosynthesis protein